MKNGIAIIFLFLLKINVFAQQPQAISLTTKVGLMYNATKYQHYICAAIFINGTWHFSKTDGPTIGALLTTDGRFSFKTSAAALASTTTPQIQYYTNNQVLKYRELSLGWHHYFIGNYDTAIKRNVYGTAAFGILFCRATNSFDSQIDLNKYKPSYPIGNGNFTRLTLDFGLGMENHIGGGIYLVSEAKVVLPLTNTPSPFITVTSKSPYLVSLNCGLRVYFD